MRKVSYTLAVGLVALGLALPGTAAQAEPTQGVDVLSAVCNDKYEVYQGDGKVHVWSEPNCGGTHIGAASYNVNDWDWGDDEGTFRGGDDNNAESLMNTGPTGSIVAFYRLTGGPNNYDDGYGCLKRSELYADNLTDNYFKNGPTKTIDNKISSHHWVSASACASDSYID